MACAGTMAFYRDLTATTRVYASKLRTEIFLPAIIFSAWLRIATDEACGLIIANMWLPAAVQARRIDGAPPRGSALPPLLVAA